MQIYTAPAGLLMVCAESADQLPRSTGIKECSASLVRLPRHSVCRRSASCTLRCDATRRHHRGLGE